MSKLAVILVRGLVKTQQETQRTLQLLNLRRKNTCVLIENNVVHQGMANKVKDYITWGEISEEVVQELVSKRGMIYKGRSTDAKEKYEYKTLNINGKKYKKYFRLNPPQKGFGRKGIKMPFKAGGALGYRGEKINDLIRRMI